MPRLTYRGYRKACRHGATRRARTYASKRNNGRKEAMAKVSIQPKSEDAGKPGAGESHHMLDWAKGLAALPRTANP